MQLFSPYFSIRPTVKIMSTSQDYEGKTLVIRMTLQYSHGAHGAYSDLGRGPRFIHNTEVGL